MRIVMLTLCLMASVLVGCAPVMPEQTDFMTVQEDNRYVYCRYETIANAEFPLRSHEAETARIRWLEIWLDKYGFRGKNYEIVSRNPIQEWGDSYNIFYEIKVTK